MPVADFLPSLTKGCPPFEVNFVNTSIGGLPYSWSFGDGNESNESTVTHTFNEPGEYKVKLTATAPLGMVVEKDTIITVFQHPTANFEIAPDTVYTPGEHISCYNFSENVERSIWYFGDGNSVEEYAPKFMYEEEGTFDIALTVYSSDNCKDSMVIYDAIEVLPRSDFFFPQAFTPNPYGGEGGRYDAQDRSNDVFYPIVVNGELLEYEMLVYNRSGVLVFQTDDIDVGWDGYYKDKMLPQDVYVYLIKGRFNNGIPFNKTGNALLIVKNN